MSTSSDSPGPYPADDDVEMENSNGVDGHEDMNGDESPAPPPHKTPSPPPKPAFDAEACKATGNKYFKAKDYTRAIAEYTKGEKPKEPVKFVFCQDRLLLILGFLISHYCRTAISYIPLQSSCCIHVRKPI